MKKIKMVIYGEPGVGKSVFASQAPNPFFICTDGNYEWLEDWGAKEENHVQVFSWTEAKKIFNSDFSKYETLVIDLTEDLFKWCEYEFCQEKKLTHLSELDWGKGYDITRNEFFIEIAKLFNLDMNVILIMHGITTVVKDRRGVENTKFGPTDRLPAKLIARIEGRVRYFVRAFAVMEENDGKLAVKRYLSLSPDGTTEFGITRGLSADAPETIPLDWNIFYDVVTKYTDAKKSAVVDQTINKALNKDISADINKEANNSDIVDALTAKYGKPEVKEETLVKEAAPVEEATPVEEPTPRRGRGRAKKEEVHEVDDTPAPVVEEPVKEEPKSEVKEEPKAEVKTNVSNEDKIAAIKAKLAALKKNNG